MMTVAFILTAFGMVLGIVVAVYLWLELQRMEHLKRAVAKDNLILEARLRGMTVKAENLQVELDDRAKVNACHQKQVEQLERVAKADQRIIKRLSEERGEIERVFEGIMNDAHVAMIEMQRIPPPRPEHNPENTQELK